MDIYTLLMSNRSYTIRQAHWPQERAMLSLIRESVFIEEQGVPPEMEWDDEDMVAYHLLAIDQHQQPIATARLLGTGQIGRMAVLPEWRNRGIGTALLQEVIQQANRNGMQQLFLHAQIQAEPFYKRSGFTPTGEIFYEANIAHRKMFLSIILKKSVDRSILITGI
jgi:predicted GNAT family N-acyltransferase